MSIFQTAVLNKYLAGIADETKDAYVRFKAHFGNPQIQATLREIKEEEYQEGFLRDLFVNVLGYTLKPNAEFNLLLEKKNETDSKKTDGAIVKSNGTDVVGVIELKDHKTIDLSKVEDQAFGYKNSHRNAVYVIISNFEKLRFYIENKVDFEEFNLFTLDEKAFQKLWLCLSWNSISKDLPRKIKSDSSFKEEEITKEFYKDYSEFKRDLFFSLLKNNPQRDRLALFKNSQKLLDRLLFIFFAQGRGLLPPNAINDIVIKHWKIRKLWEKHLTLYSSLVIFFDWLDRGNPDSEINHYNGGLFKKDEIIDSLKIDDSFFEKWLIKFSGYDFESDVDINILGHIFEHSLTEIEEIEKTIKNG
ncbi:MAG: hypothetical protein LBM75_00220, partial [Myxococcales bacterium]|nr:hypothetical protein [Myxococcales bacterium]